MDLIINEHTQLHVIVELLAGSYFHQCAAFVEIDDAVYVRDLSVEGDVRILDDPDELVARLAPAKMAVADLEEEEEEELEGEAVVDAEAEAPGEAEGEPEPGTGDAPEAGDGS